MAVWERPGIGLVKADGGIDIASELFERVRRTRIRHRQTEHRGWRSAKRVGSDFHQVSAGLAQLFQKRLLKLPVGIDVDGVAVPGECRERIFAEVEAGDAGGLFSPPATGADIAVLAFVKLDAGGGKTKFARPVKRHLVAGESRRIAEPRIPVFA